MGFGDRIDYTDEIEHDIDMLQIIINLVFTLLGFVLVLGFLCSGLAWWVYYLFIR